MFAILINFTINVCNKYRKSKKTRISNILKRY